MLCSVRLVAVVLVLATLAAVGVGAVGHDQAAATRPGVAVRNARDFYIENGTYCSGPGRCVYGGLCATGYRGYGCAACARGYYRELSSCIECSSRNIRVRGLVFLCVFVSLLGLIGFGAEIGLLRSAFVSLLQLLQLMGLLSYLRLPFDDRLMFTLRAASVVLGNPELLALECYVPSYGFFGNLALSVLGGLCASGVVMMLVLLTRAALHNLLLRRSTDYALQAVTATKLSHALLPLQDAWRYVVLVLFHPWLVLHTASVFACRQFPDGTYRLVSRPTVQCFTQTWRGYAFVAAFLGLLTLVVAPLWFAWFLRSKRTHVLERHFVRRYGALYMRYAPARYWWEIVPFGARVLVAVAPSLPLSSTLQIGVALQVVFVYLLLLASVWPHLRRMHAVVDIGVHTVLFVALSMGLMLLVGVTRSERRVTLALCLALVLAPLLGLALLLVRSAIAYLTSRTAYKMPLDRRVDERLATRRCLAPELYRYLDLLPPDERLIVATACRTLLVVKELAEPNEREAEA